MSVKQREERVQKEDERERERKTDKGGEREGGRSRQRNKVICK